LIGQIDYINLLPFDIFLKKHYPYYTTKKSYPSKINRLFEKKIIDCAFISSIKSKNRKCFDAGIIVQKEVLSVLVCEGENKDDFESNTSNILAKILHQQGEVIIGDKALKRYKDKNCKDLAKLWYERYGLPFVFATFCTNKNKQKYQKMVKKFLNSKTYIPQYILKKYSQRGITPKEIKNYLKLIYYKIGWKEKKSLKKFLKLAKNCC
jgi:chorismate dehydratase